MKMFFFVESVFVFSVRLNAHVTLDDPDGAVVVNAFVIEGNIIFTLISLDVLSKVVKFEGLASLLL